MKAALIDNWTIQNIVANSELENGIISPELKKFIVLSIVWDELYYVDSELSLWWKDYLETNSDYNFLSILKPLKINEEIQKQAANIYDTKFYDKETKIVANKAIEYLISATANNANYVPCEQRADFMMKHNLYEEYNMQFTRNGVISDIDNEIWHYLKEVSNSIKQSNMIFDVNSLYDEVSGSIGSIKDIDHVIKEYRKRPMVSAFRQWANELEENIRQGKLVKADEYKRELEIIQGKKTMDISVNISLFNCFGISVSLPLRRVKPGLVFPCYLYQRGKERGLKGKS